MSDSRQQYFIQSVAIDGEAIERDLVIKANYIESLGLRAPVLMIDIHDPARKIISDKKISSKTVITITAGDPRGEGAFFKDDFVVISYPLVNDTIKIQAVSKGVAGLLVRASKPIYLNQETSKNILAVFSKMPVESTEEQRELTIHVNNAEKPAYALMRMAKESGMAIWSAGGKVFLKKYADFKQGKAAFRYEASNPSAEKTITQIAYVKNEYLEDQATGFNFIGFNANEGFQRAGNSSAPTRIVSSGDPQTLANLSTSFKAKLDIVCEGNTDLTVGMVLDIVINRYDEENQIDESIPTRMVIGAVAHSEDRVMYRNRMILGVYE